MGQTHLEDIPLEKLVATAAWILIAEFLGTELRSKPFDKGGSFKYNLLKLKVCLMRV
jgi:hypothetical protein